MSKNNPKTKKAWKKLKKHYEEMKYIKMKDMFASDSERFSKYSLTFQDILIDYSKNIINKKTITLLLDLANELDLNQAIQEMFSGKKINKTENRAVLHTALRNISNNPVKVDGKDVMPEVNKVLKHMEDFSNKIISGEWKGYTGKSITDVVNIGIGGSSLGPEMISEALIPYKVPNINLHFVSNIDSTHISEVLKKVNSETTLFIIASKTFTTDETMTNTHSAKKWFLKFSKKEKYIKNHFVAISTNKKDVKKFGIDTDNMFIFWDWVCGRYSLWSAIGLSVCCSIGFQNFKELLIGAYEMDKHFQKTTFDKNIPVILALISIWYNNFFQAESQAILPYDQYMHYFPTYLQQLNMESSGKNVDRDGYQVDYQTGSIIWGGSGTNGQHTFYQLIHQGTKFIPCDFLAPANSHNPLGDHHQKLLSNFFAQSEALMKGKTKEEVLIELKESGKSEDEIKKLLPFKVFQGNKPTNSILFKKLTPKTLGSLITMYEHKVFVQGVIFNIFSFDQWGVELGKQLAKKILPKLKDDKTVTEHDCSTNNLINIFKKMRVMEK